MMNIFEVSNNNNNLLIIKVMPMSGFRLAHVRFTSLASAWNEGKFASFLVAVTCQYL